MNVPSAPQNIAVPVELANQIAAYLSRQPFADVVQLIMGLQQCASDPGPMISPGPGPDPKPNPPPAV